MRLKLKDAKIYTNEFVLAQTACCSQQEITIEEGYMDFDSCLILQECAKAEREKVWEMARKLFLLSTDYVCMSYNEIEDCFGTRSITAVLKTPVDDALEKYEAWKKKNSVEELLKSLKPQDVVAVPSPVNNSVKNVMMITMLEHPSSLSYRMQGIDSDGCTVAIARRITDYKGLEKIGRVVETTDILGEIKKIEDEWRKNR